MRFPPPGFEAPIPSTRPSQLDQEAEVAAVEVLPLALQTPLRPVLAASPEQPFLPLQGETLLDEQGLSQDDFQCIEQQLTEDPQLLEEQQPPRRKRPKKQNRRRKPQKSRPSHLCKTGLLIDLN